jgi:hypothetical protein
MFSFRNLALLLVLTASATLGLKAQGDSSTNGTPGSTSSSTSGAQTAPAATPAAQTPAQPPLTVQARIRARREARRAAAIHDVYNHLYEVYVGAGYLRFTPGPQLQRVNEYAWDVGVSRYFNEKLGVTIDGRGTYGKTFVGLPADTSGFLTNPSISQYAGMIGPTYRFILHPKYSVSGRVLAGGAFGRFSGDLGAFKPSEVGLYPNGASAAVSASVPVEYNFSTNIGLRIAPEYVLTNFGSTIQNSLGFTGGVVVRWGKQ